MKMRFSALLSSLLILTIFYGCSDQIEARRPLVKKRDTRINESIAMNKARVASEDKFIASVIDTMSISFERSGNGFYYHFIKKDSVDGPQPEFNDQVTFAYNLSDLGGNVIYTTEELSPLTRNMETEYGIFKGMRAALKMMQEGDKAIFIFPSYTAFGYYGDEKRIGSNIPLISEVELLDLKKRNQTNE
jgi:gliding motility-associated peptidyl-prolyl isomerase